MEKVEQNEGQFANAALQSGFSQCVYALRRTLFTTPVGWVLLLWFCWTHVPITQMQVWLGSFFVIWTFCVWQLHWIVRQGPDITKHRNLLLGVAGLDGFAWGLASSLLSGYDSKVDAEIVALLCGVGAVTAPVFITYIRAYFVQLGALWAVALVGLVFFQQKKTDYLDFAVGLTVFLAMIAYYMRSVALRVSEAIRLQLANASLSEQLRVALQMVKQDAATDALTGQGNRRSLDELLKQQMELAEKIGRPFSVLMLDIDFFKKINDTHGHIVGDDTLRAFAARVREHLRQGDVCARFGGEEFVIVLPGTTLQTAMEVAERLRRGVADSDLLSEPAVRVTVSIGAATHTVGRSVEELIHQADAAVYAAKRGGRNQVISSASATA
jgi:diguanylate cyclase (GGDEF)-like protein